MQQKNTILVFAMTKSAEYQFGMRGLRAFREARGLSQAQLAELVGTSQPQIGRLESGERKLTKEWAERLGPPLRVSPEALIFGASEEHGMPIMGVIKAGEFRDISLEDQSEERPRITVAKDGRFPQARQYALHVAGDSMNEMFSPGSYVTCVDLHESGLALTDGMIVHVERSMGGGQYVETTLKELRRKGDGRFVLVPRSTNPLYKTMELSEQDGVTIEVRGVVTGKWEPIRF